MRTRHLVDGKPKYTNALAHETSPYLLQHKHNPVDWRAWNEASLAEAKARDVPIFLSVGYSTCHWCHVMEEESFEDEEVAAAINRAFVPIKVDREERPDVDGIYMTAVQALTGRGGWPMSVFLTPAGKPFFAGTYFPARDGDRGSGMGFLTICKRLADAWKNDRSKVTGSADEIAGELAQLFRTAAPTDLPPVDVIDHAVKFYSGRFDQAWGGLEPAPKFPSSLPLRVLTRHYARTGDDDSLEMA
ncbi:MAG TPA: thioredoxin domain-containing protein, partial [Myxococcota bacterium]